ncbi:MAG: nucleotidyltransferase family protein [Terriglobales bacterium]
MPPTSNFAAAPVSRDDLAGVCRRFHVRELSLFGSAARGEVTSASDVDLLVEFQPGATTDLVDFAGLTQELERLFGKRVDLVSKPGLNPKIRSAVLAEARSVYAA